MAEFPDRDEPRGGRAGRTHEEGYRAMDAYSPFPIHELVDALDAHDNRVQRNRAARRDLPA